jgi:hypothetical protein
VNVINVIVIGWEGVDCICLSFDRDKWLAFMSMIMNDFSGSIKCGEYKLWNYSLLKKGFFSCSWLVPQIKFVG